MLVNFNIPPSSFRRNNVSPIEKSVERLDDSYYLANAKAIYSSYMSNGMVMSRDYVNEIEYNRKYAKGWIDVEKLRPSENKSQSSKMFSNELSIGLSRKYVREEKELWNQVDWNDYRSIAPKIVELLIDQIAGVDYNVSADVSDPISKDKELDKKWRSMVNVKFADVQKAVADMAGAPIEEDMFLPESTEELEMVAAAGGFKHRHAVATQNIIRAIFDSSHYADDKEAWANDIMCSEYICAITYVDSATGQLMCERVDPIDASVQWSKYDNHRDSEYGFVYTTKSVSELVAMGIPYQLLRDSVKIWEGHLGNPMVNYEDKDVDSKILGMKVQVMRCFWIDCEFGIRRVFETSLICGTDICFNSGICQSQGRYTNNKNVFLPLVMIKINRSPIVTRMRGWVDMFYVGVKKLELGMKMSRPNGYQINLHQLNNTQAGLQGKPSDFLKMFADTRILPFMQSVTGAYQGGAVAPITPISGDVGTIIQNAQLFMMEAVTGIYEVTGLNPQMFSAMAQIQSRTATEATYQMAQANAVVKPYIQRLMSLKERLAMVIKARTRTQAKNKTEFYDIYKYLLSESDIDALVLESQREGECSLKMVIKPTAEYIAEMKAQAHEAAMGNLISYGDYLYIVEMLNSGVDIKMIRMFITYKIERAKKEKRETDIALQKAQAQANAEYEQVRQQGKIAEVQQEGQIKGTVEAMKQDAQSKREIELEKEKRKTLIVKYLAEMQAKTQDQEGLLQSFNSETNA